MTPTVWKSMPDSEKPMKPDKLTQFFNRFYLLIFALVFLVFVGLSFLAPVLMHWNMQTPAKLIYSFFFLFCHQLPYRSFFLFGSQAYYPLAEAGINGMLSFEEAVHTYQMRFTEAKAFVGNAEMGYKTALCQRDIAIYLAIALFCILFMLTNYRLPRLHWSLWIILGLIPMALDGFSQLFSSLFPALFTSRESTPALRVLTGGMFGFMTAWFLFPWLHQKIKESSDDANY